MGRVFAVKNGDNFNARRHTIQSSYLEYLITDIVEVFHKPVALSTQPLVQL